MKTCPVCHAKAFDDAAVCYGCLHRFEASDLSTDEKEGVETVVPLAVPSTVQSPGFYIRITPIEGVSGEITWGCAVELAS